jgi:trigger factor
VKGSVFVAFIKALRALQYLIYWTIQMAPVETLEKLERRITISIPRDEVQSEVDKLLQVRARTAKAPGFRQGKVPMKMVAAQHEHEIRANVLHEKIGAVFSATASEHNLRVAGYPRIDAKLGDDVPATHIAFHATFEVYPEIKIGDLSVVEIEKAITEIAESEIEKTVNILRKRQAHYHVKGEKGEHGDGGPDQTAQSGDRVTIDFVGTLEGVEFPGGKADDYAFILGEGQMLPEFETAITGMRVGDVKKFPLPFPEDYQSADVAGKTAEFTVTLKKLEWAHMPEIDADFVKALGIESGDVNLMRADINDNLVRESDIRLKELNKNHVMDALLKVAEFDVPKALVDQEIEHLVKMMRQNMAQNGMDPANLSLPPEVFAPQADRRVRLGLILGDLVKKHDLKATAEQIRAKVESLAKSYQDPEMVINYYYGDSNRIAEVESLVVEDNVLNFVLGQAKIKEKMVPFSELMSQKAPS